MLPSDAPAPNEQEVLTLRMVVDHLFEPNARYHVTKDGQSSQHVKDLAEACKFANSNLLKRSSESNAIEHVCEVDQYTGRFCCASQACFVH